MNRRKSPAYMAISVVLDDNKACAGCLAFLGKIYGHDNAPLVPCHPNCRCRKVDIFDDLVMRWLTFVLTGEGDASYLHPDFSGPLTPDMALIRALIWALLPVGIAETAASSAAEHDIPWHLWLLNAFVREMHHLGGNLEFDLRWLSYVPFFGYGYTLGEGIYALIDAEMRNNFDADDWQQRMMLSTYIAATIGEALVNAGFTGNESVSEIGEYIQNFISNSWDYIIGKFKGAGNGNSLPNANKATVDVRKVNDYALNPNNMSGGADKARVFESALGYNQSNSSHLMNQIQQKLPNNQAVLGKLDQYGQRFTVDIPITGANGNSAIVRTGWILEPGADVPRMTTIFVK